uniref:Secreted protein n=1 Tax=Steinernema glaseri TaxID=37863 RepID=A0A1I7Y1D6_9BILA
MVSVVIYNALLLPFFVKIHIQIVSPLLGAPLGLSCGLPEASIELFIVSFWDYTPVYSAPATFFHSSTQKSFRERNGGNTPVFNKHDI